MKNFKVSRSDKKFHLLIMRAFVMLSCCLAVAMARPEAGYAYNRPSSGGGHSSGGSSGGYSSGGGFSSGGSSFSSGGGSGFGGGEEEVQKKNMIRDRKFREIGLTRVPEVVVQKIKSRAMLK